MSPCKRATSEEITLVSGIVVLALLSRAREGCFQIPTYRNRFKGRQTPASAMLVVPRAALVSSTFPNCCIEKTVVAPLGCSVSTLPSNSKQNLRLQDKTNRDCKTKPTRVLRASFQVSEGLLPFCSPLPCRLHT